MIVASTWVTHHLTLDCWQMMTHHLTLDCWQMMTVGNASKSISSWVTHHGHLVIGNDAVVNAGLGRGDPGYVIVGGASGQDPF